jgi:enamine deaminase RidA (YjgF/YER057c/UK114 family)
MAAAAPASRAAGKLGELSMAIKRIQPGPRMSGAVVHNNTVYVAGQVANTVDADVKTQTREVLAKIDGLLREAGSDKSKLLAANIWLTDIRSFNDMNAVWDAWVSPGNTPARATVEANLAAPGLRVEIAVIAAID